LKKDVGKRPTAEKALQHPFILNAAKREEDELKEGAKESTQNSLSNLGSFNT